MGSGLRISTSKGGWKEDWAEGRVPTVMRLQQRPQPTPQVSLELRWPFRELSQRGQALGLLLSTFQVNFS